MQLALNFRLMTIGFVTLERKTVWLQPPLSNVADELAYSLPWGCYAAGVHLAAG